MFIIEQLTVTHLTTVAINVRKSVTTFQCSLMPKIIVLSYIATRYIDTYLIYDYIKHTC